MDINELLIEAHKILDAATIDNELSHEAMCMYHLGHLHGLLIVFCSSLIPEPLESAESSEE